MERPERKKRRQDSGSALIVALAIGMILEVVAMFLLPAA
jgi:hypothetical protein